jgi:GT2 family glycosyltransferase
MSPTASGPTVSVVITHCNRPEQLRAAVQSVQGQTRLPDEVLIVDDMSAAEVKRAIRDLSSVAKIHHNDRNLGPSGSRNAGVAQASGEWVAFLDDDDLYLPHRLEKQLAYLRQNPDCGYLGGAAWGITSQGTKEYWGERETGPKSLREVLTRTAAIPSTVLAKQDVLIRNGGFTPKLRWLEDFELGIRLVAAGVGVHFLAEPLILYRHGDDDQATARGLQMLVSHLAIIFRYRALYRREFGTLGAWQMVARVCRKRGRRAGLPGTVLWGLAHAVYRLTGDHMGSLDDRGRETRHESR